MKTMQSFHLASIEDAVTLLALVSEYYTFEQMTFDATIIQPALMQLLADPTLGKVWLIQHHGTNVGYLILTFGFDLEFGGRQATVTELYLQEGARYQGLGTAALTLVEQTCRSLGIGAFELQVARTNHAAQRFYESFGMEKHDRVPMSKVVEISRAGWGTMSHDEDYLQMIWPQHLLDTPPEVSLPAGYTLRNYQSGDESGYYQLMAQAGFPEWNDGYLTEWMGRILPKSWFMVVHEETSEIVATAMACHDHSDLHPFGGALGWVAGHPAHAGKGLGRAVSAAITIRLLEMGYDDIHLHTEDERLAAITIYLKLGYLPLFYASGMESRWRAIYDKLNWSPEEPSSIRVTMDTFL